MTDTLERNKIAVPTGHLPGCGTCRHWLAIPNAKTGLCRRYPPQSHVMGLTQNAIGQQQPVSVTMWPETAPVHLCGEHLVKVAVLGEIDFSALDVVEGEG